MSINDIVKTFPHWKAEISSWILSADASISASDSDSKIWENLDRQGGVGEALSEEEQSGLLITLFALQLLVASLFMQKKPMTEELRNQCNDLHEFLSHSMSKFGGELSASASWRHVGWLRRFQTWLVWDLSKSFKEDASFEREMQKHIKYEYAGSEKGEKGVISMVHLNGGVAYRSDKKTGRFVAVKQKRK
ncbi:unnamed protein product [Clonostachys solani]|uniref:Uncharacterized protein n=1 Tax=Clonostachys solani TaxID=160281 RepID=A0A9P0EP95_9HYPO|nr:unnamed protein product [Clonostachys solani]